MYKIVFISIIWVSVCSVSRVHTQRVDFKPDTTINKKIILNNIASVEKELGDMMPKVDKTQDLPDIYLLSKDKTQYLRMIFFPGSTKNSFSFFEVGIAKSEQKSYLLTTIPQFQTESSIKIGMRKEQVVAIKGQGYRRVTKSKEEILIYEIKDITSPFLKKYNMPSYISKFHFVNGVLQKFEFGFVYP